MQSNTAGVESNCGDAQKKKKKFNQKKGRGNNGAPQPMTSEIKEWRLVLALWAHTTRQPAPSTETKTWASLACTAATLSCRTQHSLPQMSHVEGAKMGRWTLICFTTRLGSKGSSRDREVQHKEDNLLLQMACKLNAYETYCNWWIFDWTVAISKEN